MAYPNPTESLDLSRLRPEVERLTAHAQQHGLTLIDPEETAAQIPPVLAELTNEFGGVIVDDDFAVNLLIEERTDLGPYTLLGDPDEYYSLYEGAEDAVILTIGPDGTAGGVWFIDDELDLHQLAASLEDYLARVADAFEAVGADSGERVRLHLLNHALQTVSVLERVDDLDATVRFSADGQRAEIVRA